MQDTEIITGLMQNGHARLSYEKAFYQQYSYFIGEGCRKYSLGHEDGFSAYSDAVLAAILNIRNGSFGNHSSLKTYLYQIFSNKCIDLVRKKTTNKEQVHQSASDPELLGHLSDAAKTVIEKLIDRQKMQAIKQYLEVIGEKCKEILLLFEDGYTDAEIAATLSYNNAAVAKTTRLRCLDKIREKMKNLVRQHE